MLLILLYFRLYFRFVVVIFLFFPFDLLRRVHVPRVVCVCCVCVTLCVCLSSIIIISSSLCGSRILSLVVLIIIRRQLRCCLFVATTELTTNVFCFSLRLIVLVLLDFLSAPKKISCTELYQNEK